MDIIGIATKHYYAGTERIASSLGGELPEATIIGNPDADITEKVNNIFSTTYSSHLQRINTDIPEKIKHIPMRDTGIGGTSTSVENIPFPTSEIQFRTLSIITAKKTEDFVKDKIEGVLSGNTTTDKYFYHSDHLGSASWITDGTGTPVQHLQYTAWGVSCDKREQKQTRLHYAEREQLVKQPLLDQRLADYNERYTFSGKERDEESFDKREQKKTCFHYAEREELVKQTGLNYFGFRYHLAKAQFWTGVDPLSDKYPSTSPYAYCNNNPVMLVDPDGRRIASWSLYYWNIYKESIVLRVKQLTGNEKYSSELDRLTTLQNDMLKMEESKRTYALLSCKEGDSELLYDKKMGVYFIKYESFELFLQEASHGGQIENGRLGFNENGQPTGLDINDEFDSHSTSRAYYLQDFLNKKPYTVDELRKSETIDVNGNITRPYENLPNDNINATPPKDKTLLDYIDPSILNKWRE